MPDVLNRLEPSLGRRWFGVICLAIVVAGLGVWLLYRTPETWGGRVVLLIVAGILVWQAQWNLRVTQTGLTLREDGIYDDNGMCICQIDNILQIDAGLFAFKPSNGFLIHLARPEPSAWAPGLYWRLGRRLGIGGAIRPHQAKKMAQAITLIIDERAMGAGIPT